MGVYIPMGRGNFEGEGKGYSTVKYRALCGEL